MNRTSDRNMGEKDREGSRNAATQYVDTKTAEIPQARMDAANQPSLNAPASGGLDAERNAENAKAIE